MYNIKMLYYYYRISKKYDLLDKIIFICFHANDNQISYRARFIKNYKAFHGKTVTQIQRSDL